MNINATTTNTLDNNNTTNINGNIINTVNDQKHSNNNNTMTPQSLTISAMATTPATSQSHTTSRMPFGNTNGHNNHNTNHITGSNNASNHLHHHH